MDTASTSDAVTFITYVQALKRKIKAFEKQVDVSESEPDRLLNFSGWKSPATESDSLASFLFQRFSLFTLLV